MNGLKKILDSYKGIAFLLCLVIVGALVGFGKVPYEEFVAFVKWGFSALVIARGGEEGLKGLGTKKKMKTTYTDDAGNNHVTVVENE